MDRLALAVLAVVLGLLFGSFMSVVVSRVPAKESVVAPRSRCPNCGALIRAYDNVPVVSYLVLGGKCRSCGHRISILYPLLELGTAGLFVGAALRFDEAGLAALMAAFLWVLLCVSVIDVQHRIIPNRIVYPAFVGLLAGVGVADLAGWGPVLWRGAVGAAVYGGGLLLIAIIAPRGMGMGDVKLAATIGLVLGSLSLSRVGVAAGDRHPVRGSGGRRRARHGQEPEVGPAVRTVPGRRGGRRRVRGPGDRGRVHPAADLSGHPSIT